MFVQSISNRLSLTGAWLKVRAGLTFRRGDRLPDLGHGGCLGRRHGRLLHGPSPGHCGNSLSFCVTNSLKTKGWIEPKFKKNSKAKWVSWTLLCCGGGGCLLGSLLGSPRLGEVVPHLRDHILQGDVVTSTGSICRNIQPGPTWCAFARSPCSAFLKLVWAEGGESPAPPAPPPSSPAWSAAGDSKQGISRLSIQAGNNRF